jgi:2,4-dienoyl-CoA reductase (NADPH2)
MALYEPFKYSALEELKEKAESLGLAIDFSDNLQVLLQEAAIGTRRAPNRFSTLPMEGRDSCPDGSPSELTFRRYRRYGAGGWGLIQFEACAVWRGGRSSDRQLAIGPSTEKSLAALLEAARDAARSAMGQNHSPLCLLQLQDAGRYRHATGTTPGLTVPYPLLDRRAKVPEDTPPLSDEDIEKIQDKMTEAAVRAEKLGFDGIDIKSCHRYLGSELLAAHLRPGKFGGDFDGRTRFLRELTERIRGAVKSSDFLVTSRMNLFDGFPYPYGWGCDRSDPPKPDMTEPLKLVGILKSLGLDLLTTSAGTPYYNPWLVRPFDRLVPGNIEAPEHPLEGAARLFSLTGEVQRAFPDLPVAGSGYTWLRQYGVFAAAANVGKKAATMAGFGRTAFAYPGLPRDVMEKGAVDPGKVCVSCSLCSEVMSQGGSTGCYAKDREVYGPMLKEHRASRKSG